MLKLQEHAGGHAAHQTSHCDEGAARDVVVLTSPVQAAIGRDWRARGDLYGSTALRHLSRALQATRGRQSECYQSPTGVSTHRLSRRRSQSSAEAVSLPSTYINTCLLIDMRPGLGVDRAMGRGTVAVRGSACCVLCRSAHQVV